ncbi:hypothetical protein VPNG_09168 [Cytospora leucostoma]|uniref:2EXR domain-containing protein n=1 Tax=Cytospora leucostoma TaxID=1230097 RepID=A0A423VYL4_9PEZI|nr:hypothetical protein VPNG_09168 [Cytospora leucostoma]
MTATARFTLFSNLPPELRIQIWQDALPDTIGPGLYRYRPGCWEPRHITESDYNYTPGDDRSNWEINFRYDRLGSARFNNALVSVNREARDVALDWAAKRDVEIRQAGDSHVLLRHFDPERDCMYVSPDDWDAFLTEEIEVPWEFNLDQQDRSYHIECHVTRIAVPEAIFTHKDATWRGLDDLFDGFSSIQALYVVSGPLSDMPSPGSDGDLPGYCEIDILQGTELVWDLENKNWLPQNAVEETQNQVCDEVILQASQELYKGLAVGIHNPFRLCKAYLVK